MGHIVRIKGFIALKSFLFKEAYFELKSFLEKYPKTGSREEGRAIGDLCQLIVGTEQSIDSPVVVHEDLTRGIVLADKVFRNADRLPCELAADLVSHALNRRMIDRGYLTADERSQARENDRIWLVMVHATIQLHRITHQLSHYEFAEAEFHQLNARFLKMQAKGMTHSENHLQSAVFFCLAQISHLRGSWEEARLRWDLLLGYVTKDAQRRKHNEYQIHAIRYSLADVHCSLGNDPHEVIAGVHDSIIILFMEKRSLWGHAILLA
jgi:hypothetical protein